MSEEKREKWQRTICAAGLALLALLFVLWLRDQRPGSAAEIAAALVCLLLFAAACLRFVPRWLAWWFGPGPARAKGAKPLKSASLPLPAVFALGLLCGLIHLAAVWAVLRYVNHNLTAADFKRFWTAADAYHYLSIAREWYLSEGSVDRVVQLVFLPGYPLAVRLMHVVVKDWIIAGMLVSILSFSGVLCVLYRLARLDLGEDAARRAIAFACLMPGAFFFFAPMSESLFLLLCLGCVFSARRGRWLPAGIFGALASFTRSLGLMLFVPLFFEIVFRLLHGERKAWRGAAALVLIPAGFAAYCVVNYLVSGDAFRFLVYQREHWNQQLGLFFNTAAYQTRYALSALSQGKRETLMGLWLPNLAAVLGVPALLFAAGKRLRPGDTAWALAYYAIAVGATWLLSAPRYMAALPPLPLALAQCTEKKSARIALFSLLALAELYYLVMFALRRSVW